MKYQLAEVETQEAREVAVHSPKRTKKLTYRSDIDGLRAIAVLLVVFDHLHLWFLGGYIGVDIFFVISGYLISSAIISEMNEGAFSISSFYERRIRRIFPALLVMLLVTSALAYRYFVPAETVSYARSMLTAVFSVSNIYFWQQSGYFDEPSLFKPLLHTWSLAVEEQFYIFFPIFLMLVQRWAPRRLKASIWTIAGVSFAVACFWVERDATTAFFFAPLRAWELLIGTVLSQRYLPDITGKLWRNLASLSGLILIMAPAVMFTARTHFPGLAALPPCLGAALIIAAGETGPSVVGRILSWRPVVFVGLISYSLYLWHWPIIVFQHTNSILVQAHAGSRRVPLIVFVLSLIVATLSWRFVETPFRKGRFRPNRQMLFVVSGAAVSVVVALALYMDISNGLPRRFPKDALAVARYEDFDTTESFRVNTCFLTTKTPFSVYRPDICLKPDPPRKQYLLLGDSHSAHLYHGLAAEFPELNISQATVAACKSYLTEPPEEEHTGCGMMSKYIYGDYLLHHHVDAVLLSGRWVETDFPEIGRTIAWIQQHGMKVILFGPVPEFDASLPRILATSIREHDPRLPDVHFMPQLEDLDKKMAIAARKQWHVAYISTFQDICASQVEMDAKAQPETSSGCPLYAAPGVPLLIDSDHFSPEGSVLFAKAIREHHQLP